MPWGSFFRHVDHLSPSLQPVKELKRPVGHMVCVDRSVVVVFSVAVVILPAPNTKMSDVQQRSIYDLFLSSNGLELLLDLCRSPD